MKPVEEIVELRVRGEVVDRGLVVGRIPGPDGARHAPSLMSAGS